jgi:uncharacterized repeat protein (TIGR03803 family)
MKNELKTLALSSWASISLAHGAMALGAGILIFSTGTSAWSQQEEASTPPVYSVLYRFQGGTSGAFPFGPYSNSGTGTGTLAIDSEGNLYGTTFGGGICGPADCGVVFKLDPAGNETVAHAFSSGEGANPVSGVVLDGAGNRYGTAPLGGAYNWGVIYKLDHANNYTIIHSFTAAEGYPSSGIVRDANGNLFGVAVSGGAYTNGMAFQVDNLGNYWVLHSFNGTDGYHPVGLLVDGVGTLYGATSAGGANEKSCSGNGCGVVFKLDIVGNETVLFNFAGGLNGGEPESGVILDDEGNLYGNTVVNGAHTFGTVYKLKTTGAERALYSFTGGADGSIPNGTMVWDYSGNLYGVTQYGGTSNCGVVFRVTPQGQETVLHTFTGGADGCQPQGGLIRVGANVLYGATFFGGYEGAGTECASNGCGTVFKLTLPGVSDQIEGQREDLGEEAGLNK